jgi:hypothetical protein
MLEIHSIATGQKRQGTTDSNPVSNTKRNAHESSPVTRKIHKREQIETSTQVLIDKNVKIPSQIVSRYIRDK